MLFPTTDFAIFLAIVFALSWLLNPHRTAWKWCILAASYVFYAWWDPRLVLLLALVSTLAWASALWVERTNHERARRRRTLVSVAALLLPLAWFKYYGFFALNVANAFESLGLHPPLPLLQVLLPIGISFYTFMAISYVVDVSRFQIQVSRWLDVSVYLAFFPHLIAGPIVRSEELIPQIRRPRDAGRIDVSRASFLIVGGLFKKMVISSFLASQIVDPVFGAPNAHGGLEVLIAIYAYAIVIYADFSAYSDIAIGVAMLLGFEFPANFDRPYTAVSLQDFWRRWHMTLSRWLRDYLYIPLGGNRRSRPKTYRNLMLTMLLGGLWHGAAWTFVLWGGIHGTALSAERFARERFRGFRLPAWAAWLVTFHVVCVAWVFFRAPDLDTAFGVLGGLGLGGPSPLVTLPLVFLVIVAVAIQALPREWWRDAEAWLVARPVAVQGIAAGAVIVAADAAVGQQGVAPFIYYQF